MNTIRNLTTAALVLPILASSIPLVRAGDTPHTMPKGISRFRVVGALIDDVTEKFNQDGLLEPLTRSLNRSVTLQNYVAMDPRLGQLVDGLNGLEPGLGNQLLGTNLYSDFSVQAKTYAMAFEFGLTSNWTLGIQLPILNRSVHARFGALSTINSEYLAEQIGKLSPEMRAGIYDVANTRFDTAFFESALFTSKGYDAPRSFSKTQIGDLEMGAKYKFFENGTVTTSTQVGVRLPTGTPSSLTNPFDTGSGDGCFVTGAYLLEEVKTNDWLSFAASQKLGVYIPDTRSRAVPKGADDALPSLLAKDGQVQDVTRSQPPRFETQVSANAKIGDGTFSTWSTLQFGIQGSSTFSGPDADRLYYEGLSQGSSYRKTELELGVGYSTIPAFLKKRFAVPIDIDLLFNNTLNGQNTPLARYGRMDVKVYF